MDKSNFTNEMLLEALPGFENGYADANGIQLHYVTGGTVEPVVILHGWTETW